MGKASMTMVADKADLRGADCGMPRRARTITTVTITTRMRGGGG